MIKELDINAVIQKYGLTKNEVAQRMGISRFTLNSHITKNPTVDILGRIAEAIGCHVTELFIHPETDFPTHKCPHCGKPIQIKLDI